MADRSSVIPTRGAAVVTITAIYFYFLLFAEFAFLELASVIAPNTGGLRVIMFGLGLGGISGAVGAARVFRTRRARALLAWTLRSCALSGLLALAARSFPVAVLAAVLTGASLGAAAVTLTAMLSGAMASARLGLGIGAGTGIAYAACNVPLIFRATPRWQTILAVLAVLAASFLSRFFVLAESEATTSSHHRGAELARWIAILLALVWLDSAAFYIVQHTPALRAATWGDSGRLWLNAGIHLGAALVAGMCLDRGHRRFVAATALVALAGAALVLNGSWSGGPSASLFYTAGVSLYSVLLVEFPARAGGRPAIAAWVFAVAGWAGSALGIGMAQDLARIPTAFVVAAGVAVAIALAGRFRSFAGTAIALVLAVGMLRADDITLGREVYIAEGCIHCHSQYIRPRVAAEVLNWGPATPLDQALNALPPLFGTRRQGPDLSHVGNRRSPEWNRLHLLAPQAISPGSRMPSYAHLFVAHDARGEALLAYLASLGAGTSEERRQQVAAWKPEAREVIPADSAAKLFLRLCAQCHGASGRGDGVLAVRLSVRPPDWSSMPWRHIPPGGDVEVTLSRIIKFGLPGLPMAGHEYLQDGEIVGLARYVRTLHKFSSSASAAVIQR